MSAWLVKTRRAPSRHSRDARAYGHTTTGQSQIEYTPTHTPLPLTKAWLLIGRSLLRPRFLAAHGHWRDCLSCFSCAFVLRATCMTMKIFVFCARLRPKKKLFKVLLLGSQQVNTTTLAHPDAQYMQKTMEDSGKHQSHGLNMTRRCGSSQSTPTALPCEATKPQEQH